MTYSSLWDSGDIAYPGTQPVAGPIPAFGCAVRPTGAQNAQSIYGSFIIDKSRFGLVAGCWADTDVRIYVDHKPVTLDPVIIDHTTDNYYSVIVENLGPGEHRVDFIIGWSANFNFVAYDEGAVVKPAELPDFRIGIMGDSYADSGIAPYYAGICAEMYRLTGCQIIQLGQGSTGYTNNGHSSGDTTKDIYAGPSRLNAISSQSVNVLLTIGSVNDGSATSTQIADATTDFYTKVGALNVPIVVAGVEPLNLPAADPSAWNAVNTQILASANAHSAVKGVIDWRGEEWLTGTGCVSDPKGDGNQDVYIGDAAGTDTIHPNYEGCKYLAGKFVDALKDVVIY